MKLLRCSSQVLGDPTVTLHLSHQNPPPSYSTISTATSIYQHNIQHNIQQNIQRNTQHDIQHNIQHDTMMEGNYTEGRFWIADDLEILVQWIEEPGNQARLKKGSALTNKAALAMLVERLASRNAQQVVD
jgi:hypothetical protein